MKRSLSLRIKVVVAFVLLVALLSAAVFYLTAIRFHQMVEGAQAAQQSFRTETATRLWERGMPAAEIARLWMSDSTILQMSFRRSDGRSEVFHPKEPLSGKQNVHVKGIEEPFTISNHNHLFIASADGDTGRVEVVFNTSDISLEVARLVREGNWILGGLIAVTGLGVFLIDRRLRRVIRNMINTTEALALGRLDHKLDIRTGDQLEELGHGLNRMATSLADRQVEIERAQQGLSATIAARTAELREERDRLSRILDNLPSAFILFDQNLHITAASSAVERLTGMIPALGGSHPCSCPQIDEGAEGCIVRLAKSKQAAIIGRQFPLHLNGQDRTMEHSVFPIKDDTNIVGWLETITDVTERVQQHERLVKAERMSAVGETAAMLAHEVRNLLTSAKMLLQIDAEADNLTDSQKKHLNITVGSIQGMQQMIEELLAFAKPSPLKREMVNLDDLVDSTINQVEPIAEDYHVKLEILNQAQRSHASLDKDKTRQVLVNLLLNAIQAAGVGGTARLTVAWDHLPEAMPSKVTFDGTANGFLRWTVDDTGSGIPINLREKVFEPFFTTRARGTGLGLATVRQIVKDYDGRIFIGDGPRGGAQFVMILPA